MTGEWLEIEPVSLIDNLVPQLLCLHARDATNSLLVYFLCLRLPHPIGHSGIVFSGFSSVCTYMYVHA